MKIFIKKATNDNPYENLALEAALSDFVLRERFLGQEVYGLFLWQSKNAIVFGRNQNIAAECNLSLAREHQVDLVRRNSGGGAVYHDLGNLNFSIIGPEGESAKDFNNGIVIEALRLLGLNPRSTGRNDFTIEGRKFSGNAYTSREGVLTHHGTLMVALDVELANRLLTPPMRKLKSKGISSVKSRIVNLSEIDPKLTIDVVAGAIADSFERAFPGALHIPCEIDQKAYTKELSKLTSEAWLSIDSGSEGHTVSGDFGYFKYQIIEKNEKIEKICYESDILEVELIECMVNYLEGTRLSEDALAEKLQEFIDEKIDSGSLSQIKLINTIGCDIINQLI